MSSRTAVRGIEFTLTLLLVSSAQAVNYEAHRHDVIVANEDDNIILTTRDFLEQLNFVAPKESYTLQEATEHLLQFGALLRARILDTFGSLLYVYYDDFSIAEVEALRKVYREILERRYDVFDLVPNVLKNQDTRPSRICAEIYDRATDTCLRSSASMCRRIRKQHDISHPDDRDTPALNVTYRMYRSSKISKQYPGGFSLATTLRFLQREALTITPNLLSGLLCNVRYENYDDDVRLAEKELVRHFHETTETEISIPTKELRKFHTVNSFLKHYIDTYAEKSLDNDLKKHAFLIARRITDDVGTIDENIHLLGNAYENGTIHIGYLFDLVLPDDLLENDVIEAKKYLVTKLNEFNVVEKYLRVQKYQQITPAQLTMEITGQLRDIDFAKSIATSLRMHARFWRGSRMIESLDDLLELFDSYENLRQVPRYARMMRKIDGIIESLRDMKDVPVEILCNAPRACLRIGLQLVLRCRFISSEIKEYIKGFLELSNVCIYPVIPPESRRSVEIPFRISKSSNGTLGHYGVYQHDYTDDYAHKADLDDPSRRDNYTHNEYYSGNNYTVSYNVTHNNYDITYYNDYNNIAYDDHNITYDDYNIIYDYNNVANNNYDIAYDDHYDVTHDDYHSIAHDNYYGIAHDDYDNVAHDNYYGIAHDDYHNIAHDNYYGIAHDDYHNIAHNDQYCIAYNNYCNNIAYGYDKATNHRRENETETFDSQDSYLSQTCRNDNRSALDDAISDDDADNADFYSRNYSNNVSWITINLSRLHRAYGLFDDRCYAGYKRKKLRFLTLN
ncbi:Zonadhesin [Temnothorax longispinosus]|uniref:Zonadhesin n=1 Tax=Temnothorax longispinosus TaxID=300112 RepID=A0A4S2KS35_9HYME|nr:Zonadhesin [Temnothorax longispinosus]